MRKVFIFLAILGFICFAIEINALAKTIKVGAAVNLTGPASGWGRPQGRGLQDYLRYVNEVKGGVAGNKIKVIMVDTGYKIPEAVASAKKFITSDKVDIIATWSTGEGLAVKPIIQRYKIPTINYSSGWELLQPPIDYFFLAFGSYKRDTEAVLDYVRIIHKGKDSPKVGLLILNNAFGRQIIKPCKEFASRHGLKIVGIEEFPVQTLDLSTHMMRLKEKEAEYVFMQAAAAHIITAIRGGKRVNYEPRFFGTWTPTESAIFKLGEGILGNKLEISSPFGVPIDRTPGVELAEKLRKQYKGCDNFEFSYFLGVGIGMIMEKAFERASKQFGNINPETITKSLELFQNEEMGGVIPPVSYSSKQKDSYKNPHEGSCKLRILRVNEKTKTFKPLTDFFVPGKERVKLLKR